VSASVRVLVAAAALAASAAITAPAHAIEQTAPISENGRYRAYNTGTTGGVKVQDRTAGGTLFASVDSDGRFQPAERQDMDWSGRHVVFQTRQPLTIDDLDMAEEAYVRDRACPYSDRIGGENPSLSPDGRYIAYIEGRDLDPGDTNGTADFYLRDRATDETEQISVGQTAGFANRLTYHPAAVSLNGRYVAFSTRARLTPDDTNDEPDVYRRDTETGTTALVSMTNDGRQGRDAGNPSISADGNIVAFDWFPPENTVRQAWARDMQASDTHTVTEWAISSNGRGAHPSVSADGTLVAFSGNQLWMDEGMYRDVDTVYVYDRVNHTTYQAPKQDPEEQQRVPDISANGRYVSWSNASTTGGVYDRGPGTEHPVPDYTPYEPRCAQAKHSAYRTAVIDDQPLTYLRFGELPGTETTHDEMHPRPDFWMGGILGAPGAITNDPNTAMHLNGFNSVGVQPFPFAGRESFSLEAWIKPQQLNGNTRRVFSNEARGDKGGYLLGVRDDGIVFSRYANGRWTTLKAPITENRWTHVVATFDGTQQVMRLYTDGTRKAVSQSTLLIPPIENFDRHLTIGSLRDQFRFFVGDIDEAAIYDKALHPARIEAHHRLGGGSS
jgi:hypothetical protein